MQTAALKGSPLSTQQARLWFLGRNSPVYHITCVIHLQGYLDRNALQDELKQLVARHEILRTAFYLIPGMDVPVQVVTEDVLPELQVVDLDELLPQKQTDLLECLVASLQHKASDLTQASLLRTWLLQLSPDSHLLLLSLPALCADASTLRLCIEEIHQAYPSYFHHAQSPAAHNP